MSFVKLVVDDREMFLGDFYDNQEWLLVSIFYLIFKLFSDILLLGLIIEFYFRKMLT